MILHQKQIVTQLNPVSYINSDKFHSIIIKLFCMLLTILLLSGLTEHTAKAQSVISLHNYLTKKTSSYTGVQAKVTLNNKSIGISGTPGILVDGVALLPYYEVFKKSGIAADCVYNSTKGTITISKYGITIAMKIGSKAATVNGKSVTLPVAPQKIKYMDTGKIRILVPSRYVSETLGLGYVWYSDKSTVSITKSTLLLSYNGAASFEYSGTRGKVSYEGDNISLGTMPSIITNNTAMLRAKKVFGDRIGADYSYNKVDKIITLSNDDNVLLMTIGSKMAYLNGKTLTLSTAPMLVTNKETKTTYVMVPGKFTANSLGYDYTWNKDTKTSQITLPEEPEAELGDSGDISETGTILNEWIADPSTYGICSGVDTVSSQSEPTDSYGMITSVMFNNTGTLMNTETFQITSSSPYYNVTSEKNGNYISLEVKNLSSINQTCQVSAIGSKFVNNIFLINHTDFIGSTIGIELQQENCQYDISLSPDQLSMFVTVYYNVLTSMQIGTNEYGDYMKLNGNTSFHATMNEGSGCVVINLPGTINSLGTISSSIIGSNYITQSTTINSPDNTTIILTLNEGYQFTYEESDHGLTLFFGSPADQTDTETETLPDLDESKYDIIIPKPANVTTSMISDQDHYFSNYFTITLEGDYTYCLSDSNITNKASTVDKITVSNSNGNTVIKIATSKLQGYRITYDSDSICIKVGNPKDIYKNIVVLDPGHGGDATGAIVNGLYEKDINFNILYTIGKTYFNQDTSKLKVYYTRASDVDMTLRDRAAFAKKVGADLFVSLHMNAASNAPNASGTEVFYSSNNNTKNSAGLTSQKLAALLNDSIYPAIGTNNRGVKEEAYTVIKENTVPAVLIELGFLTNKSDFSIITDTQKQKIAAQTIYETLLKVFELYPTGR